ncbi:Stk1 family PASTA domain-containing Ser/Thr kinase [Clostridium bowmanii]|uniref:Stk1 family PASTA domain-containing Ser/Thr kinase n=1 Tax=Clostridium bowmanii TaxID=132925 RepID=UPI001C0B215E|nr:Stk1 family PASTA domain-containing Ser/Thr kinase [Clostridium bowmanii]MBU3189205.1 Stk1 family PASTA domain-containing Ser/Thr kinase [Clostridium bowmanii]MCA1073091.1 Stk1 family PASTA domain-containing Ser/Thr kinase [Clostridium bowmanii]
MIGTILGSRYELLEKIGEGGMAIVYKAKCHLLNRYVAVKILKEEFSNNIDFMDKFKKEAASAASLSSNNIVNIYDVGHEKDINYIVMEYIKGKTLKQVILDNGSMDNNKVIDYGIQIAKALECAHKNNIIHRDIKPHNILVTEDGTVKVTDFGIAKASSSVTITNTSTVMGSAHYFSPEQAKASFVDFRTDIYSFGIVLYEMSTGRVPYDAESPVSVALKHIQEPVVPPKDINDNIPENLNKLILKAIEKEPIKRYQTAKDMRLDLQRIQNNSGYTIAARAMDNEYTRVMEAVNVDDYEKEEVTGKIAKKNNNKNINKKNKTKIIVSIAVVLLIVLATVLGLVYKNALFGNSGKVDVAGKIVVPKIIGLDKSDAKKVVEDEGLTFTEVAEENSTQPKGTVTVCFPEVGTEVKAKSEVRVRVSKGPETFTVPYVKGSDRNSAKTLIEGSGLVLGDVKEEFSDSIPSGIVISQDPSEESLVQKGDKVNLVISKGVQVKNTLVPDLSVSSKDEAQGLLQNSNLKIGDTKEVITNDKSQDGKIFNQTIAPNTTVKEGSSVGFSYYTYKEPVKEQFKVPDFIGKTVKEAKDLAAKDDITISAPGSDEDIIDSQDKEAGTKASVGDTITLTSKATVPPVTPDTPPATQ